MEKEKNGKTAREISHPMVNIAHPFPLGIDS
jgi:hypothetical protein